MFEKSSNHEDKIIKINHAKKNQYLKIKYFAEKQLNANMNNYNCTYLKSKI